ncbi:unnamed protein product [Dovyalis caffra]|uniref:Uncharacterized protein n=1 Tax=Dovyalis caffra TaxID=77055 RepID=A0AAV1S9Y3_9ROSI|nr:unnamed protein product [Dovyalis caffra]
MMDYTLPIARRTRLREAEVYKKLHDEIRKGKKLGKESNAAASGSTNGLYGVHEESFGGSSEKGSKSQSLSFDDDLAGKGLHDFGSVGVEDCEEENCAVRPVALDDIEDDVEFLDDCKRGGLKEGMDFVSLDDSDDAQSEGIENKSFNVGGKKSGGVDVGGSCSGMKFDAEESGRSKVSQWQTIVNESYNGEVFARKRNEEGVDFFSSGIGNESGGVGLNGRKTDGAARRTELLSVFCEKSKDGNGVVVVDDDRIILEKDAAELQSSSSGDEEKFKDDSDDGDYRVEFPESRVVGQEEKEEEGEEDDDREQGDKELKRKKVYGIEILCDSSIGKIENNDVDMDDSVCVGKRTRSHYNSESSKKRMKLGTVSQPLCVDEEELDDNGDNDEDDNVTYETGDIAKKIRSKKGKTESRGESGGDVDNGNETYEFHRITRSQKRIIDSRKGSRDEHLQDVCGRKPSKRKRMRVLKEHEFLNILANPIVLEQEDLPFKQKSEQLKKPVLPLKFTFGIEEPTPPVKSEEEKQLEELWADMASALRSNDTTDDAPLDENEDDALEVELDTATLCSQGNHELWLDDEIGFICKNCSSVPLEIKYYVPPFDTYPLGKSSRRYFVTMQHNIFNDLHDQDSGHDTHPVYDPCIRERGTVWNLIPGIGKGLHVHQRKGIEFMWKNIGGGIYLDKLKENTSLTGGTGCIISHAPGTGKTRLAIVFLQMFMELYPTSRPVIVAPCSMLLTWEAEFLKWGVDIPFHILNSKELSGKENKTFVDVFRGLKPVERGSNAIRLVKLYSWKNERSILGISYRLFEELVGEGRNKIEVSDKTEVDQVRKLLLELPGLLVLDEGHTPRNDKSLIWKALSKVQTQKRIILSGTPFQNNFDELYNTLCLVKPKFADEISSKLHRAFPKRRGRKRNVGRGNWASLTSAIGKAIADKLEAQRVEELRKMIQKFVHVHKGGVLRERLPGLRDSVVILQPVHLQKTLLEHVKQINGVDHFEMEYSVSLLSVHPSLLPEKSVGNQEFKCVDQRKLERLRSKPEAGVKTKFLMELIWLCQARNEKVLVFSQYLEPLNLVIKQLESKFNWIQGEDVLYMHGQLKVDERHTLIKHFNNANSEAKVLLASTKACSEGINLVGASRVVLLDVVWNPSVERQAISRAYRLGQEKVVYVYHLITSGTMEEEKYIRQVEKERLSDLVFDCTSWSSSHQKVVFDIAESEKDKILEEMVQRDKLKPMFKKIVYQPKDTNLVKSFGLDL